MYVLHNDQGEITGVVSGPGKEYGAVLDAHGEHLWIYLEGDVQLSPEVHSVDVKKKARGAQHKKCLRTKKPLSILLTSKAIKADGIDAAIFQAIPVGSVVTVSIGSSVEFSGPVNDGRLEITSPVPATYSVSIYKPGFLPFSTEIVTS